MKKILIASCHLDFGGIEKSLINLLKNLDPKKYEVTLLLQEKRGVFLKDVPPFVKVEEYTLSSCKNILFRKIINRSHFLFYTCMHRKKYENALCFATYDIPSCLLTQKLGKISTYWVHSNYKYIYDEKEMRLFFEKRKINAFDQIVCVSNEAKEDLISFFPTIKEKTVSINNLFDFKEIKKKSNEKIKLPSFQNLVFVGRLEEHSKALMRLLEIMKEFQEEGKNIALTIIGDGPDAKQYKDYKIKHNLQNVFFEGSKENPYPYMKQADLFVLPSNYEGFPVTVIEALSLKTKVLTTIDVSTLNFQLKDYVYLCKKEKRDIKDGILKALKEKNKKKFDETLFHKTNKEAIYKVIEGEIYEI